MLLFSRCPLGDVNVTLLSFCGRCGACSLRAKCEEAIVAAQFSVNKAALLEERCALLEDEAARGRVWRRKAALGGEGRVANFPHGVMVGVGGGGVDHSQEDPLVGLSSNQEHT